MAATHVGARVLGGPKVVRDDGVDWIADEEWDQDIKTKGKQPNKLVNQEDYSSRHAKTCFAVLDGLDTEDGWEQRIEILKKTLQNIPGPSRKGLRVLAHERQKGTQMKAKGSHSSPFSMQGRGDSSGKKGAEGRPSPILKD